MQTSVMQVGMAENKELKALKAEAETQIAEVEAVLLEVAAEVVNKNKKIGVEKVRSVVEKEKLVFCRVPVISNRRDSKYGSSQKELGGGWLLMTHSNNQMKKSFLDKVSEALNLGLIVNIETGI